MKQRMMWMAGLLVMLGASGACTVRTGEGMSREEFRREADARLEQLDVKIGQLADRARTATEEMRPRWNALVEDLRGRRARAADRMRDVSGASGDAWHRFKADAKAAMDDLGEAVDRGWHEVVK